ncbi:hypothetical protein ACW7G0_10985 [Lysobacter sp. A286]
MATQFVTFALQGANDVETATEFVREDDDSRRLYGLSALGQMTFADTASARHAITDVEPFIASNNDDAVRVTALSAAIRRHAVQIARHFPTIEQVSSMASPGPLNSVGLEVPGAPPEWAEDCRLGPLRYSTRLSWPED